MKWWWNGGVEREANLLRECWTFFIYIFLHQQWKQCLEFLLAKLREICKYSAGACKTVMPVGYTILLFSAKQGREINAMRRVVSENVSKELSVINSLWMRRSLFANWIHYIAAKKPQPLCENWNEKRIGEKELRPQAIMHSITRREGGGGGEVRRQRGGGGVEAGGSFT